MTEEAQAKQNIRTIREILGMDEEYSVAPAVVTAPPPVLEVATPLVIAEVASEATPAPAEVLPEPPRPAPAITVVEEPTFRRSRLFNRDMIRLPIIFVVALGFFYILLNFQAVMSRVSTFVSPPKKNTEVVLGSATAEYQGWIKKYYAFSSDAQTLAPNEDADHDGLTNMDEFYLDTNPLNPDTNHNGVSDGQEVLDGNNPVYRGRLTDAQVQAVKDRLNLKEIESRRELQLRSGATDGGYALQGFGSRVGDSAATAAVIDTFVVEPAKAGNLSIPKLGTNVAIVWTQDFANMENDLKYGVAHHPDTVYPGARGLSSIHGHSSGYPWDGGYKTAFTKINYLEPGDEVFVTVFNASGEERRYRFVVRGKNVYDKNDAAQFTAPSDGYFLNLSTSWPVGTARERYVVTTELAE